MFCLYFLIMLRFSCPVLMDVTIFDRMSQHAIWPFDWADNRVCNFLKLLLIHGKLILFCVVVGWAPESEGGTALQKRHCSE